MSSHRGLIPQRFLDEISNRVSIDEYLSRTHGVSFKKAGKGLIARCPNPDHEDKSPSFSVDAGGQICNCFVCSVGGNIFQLVQQLENLSFPAAVERLADLANLEMPSDRSKPDTRTQALRDMVSAANQIFRRNLDRETNPRIAQLISRRGLDRQTIDKFSIGVANDSWRDVCDNLGNWQRARLLSDSGLAVYQPKTEDAKAKLYDTFRNGIVFPVRDERGQIVSFARRAPDGEKPKYLNGPETALFKKSNELYGLYETLQASKNPERIYVVEGYMDVIAHHQFGLENSVAAMGTALTDSQVQKLLRYTSELVFCFDGDSAGLNAAKKTLNTILPFVNDQRRFKFCILPNDEDPDSVLRTGGVEAMNVFYDSSLPFSQFLFKSLLEGRVLSDRESLAQCASEFTDIIESIPDCVLKRDLVKRFQEITGLEVESGTSVVVEVSGLARNDVLKLAQDLKHQVSSETGLPHNAVKVSFQPAQYLSDPNERFVFKGSLVRSNLDMSSSTPEKIELLKSLMEYTTINSSLSFKHKSGLPVIQMLSDASNQSNDPVQRRLTLLSKSMVQEMLKDRQIHDLISQLSSEVVRAYQLGQHLIRNNPTIADTISTPMQRWAAGMAHNLIIIKKLEAHCPNDASLHAFQASLRKFENAVEQLPIAGTQASAGVGIKY